MLCNLIYGFVVKTSKKGKEKDKESNPKTCKYYSEYPSTVVKSNTSRIQTF